MTEADKSTSWTTELIKGVSYYIDFVNIISRTVNGLTRFLAFNTVWKQFFLVAHSRPDGLWNNKTKMTVVVPVWRLEVKLE